MIYSMRNYKYKGIFLHTSYWFKYEKFPKIPSDEILMRHASVFSGGTHRSDCITTSWWNRWCGIAGSASWECALWGHTCPWPLLPLLVPFLCYLVPMRWGALLYHLRPLWSVCLSTGLRVRNLPSQPRREESSEPKWTFLPFSCEVRYFVTNRKGCITHHWSRRTQPKP